MSDVGALPRVHRLIFLTCVAATVALVGARPLHHVSTSLPGWLDRSIGRLIHYGVLEFGFVMLGGATFGVVIVAATVLALVRRRPLLHFEGKRIGTVPWLHSLIWICVLLVSPLLDSVPRVAVACWSTLPLLWGAPARRWGWPAVLASVPLGLAICAAWISVAPDEHARRGIQFWGVGFTVLASAGVLRVRGRDRLWLAAALSALAQLSGAVHRDVEHDGVMLGDDGYAYTFCELPERERLYAAVPCDKIDTCARGYVAEHDLRDLQLVARHEFFGDDFDGRLVQLACADDVIQVSMVKARVGGEVQSENVLEFRVDDPRRFERSVLDGEMGTFAAYDRKHDAFFYSSDVNRRIFRLDRKSGELDRSVADALYGEDSTSKLGSHQINIHGFHEGRDSLFVAQWVSGSRVFELDRTTLELVQTYDPMNGGNHGVTVDDELDRLWVASGWGVDVLSIPDGESLARIWLGAGSRIAAIDRRNDLVFVPVTITGRLWVFDRRSLDVLGSLAIGEESRHAEVSADGRRVYASNRNGYFYWSTDEIARRLRGDRP